MPEVSDPSGECSVKEDEEGDVTQELSQLAISEERPPSEAPSDVKASEGTECPDGSGKGSHQPLDQQQLGSGDVASISCEAIGQSSSPSRALIGHGTALVYDDKMRLHQHPVKPHPECPDRILYIFQELQKKKLLDKCVQLPSQQATMEDLVRVHQKDHVDRVMGYKEYDGEELKGMARRYNSVYLNEHSTDSALTAAGNLLTRKPSSRQTLQHAGGPYLRGSRGITMIPIAFTPFMPLSVSPYPSSPSHMALRPTGTLFPPTTPLFFALSFRPSSTSQRCAGRPLSDASESMPSLLTDAGRGVAKVVIEVAQGNARNGVAVVRPPGHHAEASHCMGFCLINNVAVAASLARAQLGMERVMILDWDVHHGNGTQNIFADDPNVLFMSIHRYDNGDFYPGGPDADYECTGSGAGKGYTVNVAWNGSAKEISDEDYVHAFEHAVMPIATRFDPQLVLVSAGFDAAAGDPLGGCNVTSQGFAYMTHQLMSLAGGRIVLCLEGGYNLTSTAEAMGACVEVLQGAEPPAWQIRGEAKKNVQDAVAKTRKVHAKKWLSDLEVPECDAANQLHPTQQTNPTDLEVLECVAATPLHPTQQTDPTKPKRSLFACIYGFFAPKRQDSK
ncbi:hypothetical protein CYMTET_17118 [Cymbomonas tetramitiformis]|uniref:Histone deacetylase domain-containing protein n=1 Tax=Cymbomonas tetramitiformis TaxID=36881 RepID=A0AAE0GB00_9CHLO|nr:hypothetical protein CYMTET_17118 [Cymbomonas tetramitiformis]